MKRLAVMVSVWEEEQQLPFLLDSLRGVVPSEDVHCFDGRWHGFAEPTALGYPESRDGTRRVCEQAGAVWWAAPIGGYESDGPKRSAAFRHLLALGYSHCYVIDADECHEGGPLEIPEGHANVMIRSIGENDLPGLRGEWPRGDYGKDPHPQLRVFRLSPELHCKWPGGYWDEQGRIEPYTPLAHSSALPVIRDVCIRHEPTERDADRLAAKASYYAWEVPIRSARQDDQEELEESELRSAELATMSDDYLQALWREHRSKWHQARIDGDVGAEARARRALDEIEAAVDW